MKKICIIGAGSWGTALALTAHRANHKVILLTRHAEQVTILNQTHENRLYLPGIQLPSTFLISNDLGHVQEADIILQVTPAQTIQQICLDIKNYARPQAPFVICAKGIVKEKEGREPQLLTTVVEEMLPNPTVILSGPSFADEVGLNLPTAVAIASKNEAAAKDVAFSLRHTRFRCYINDDPIGVQVAGAVKNVLAIACGVVRGRNLGNNAAAALITRGLAEMRRLGVALGGKSETFLGLAGVGDVTLTCSSEQSRNMRLGIAVGKKGVDVAKILQESSAITEGVPTVAAVFKLSQKLKIPMPLCQAVYNILYDQASIDEAIEVILSRQSEVEF